jgi:hypothetical protein
MLKDLLPDTCSDAVSALRRWDIWGCSYVLSTIYKE